ncbi:hypothetical protein SAY87_000482 [Trapa incisa]|uniref:Uncharacterized protein n=1 Tax=Trapa incisa TaxID=236973 RepID=A0AAN7GC64_9MYRT|nr:hypothetical protein SAY87_000482 [Trapa incisa]
MKKLYRKGTVHPSSQAVSDPLSFLPAAIFTLAAALCPEDREVLAYLLISGNSNSSDFGNTSGHATFHHRRSPSSFSGGGSQRSCLPSKGKHPPTFSCDCFSCYMSYWLRWDCSPKRELIHEIIDQIEDGFPKRGDVMGFGTGKTRKERRKSMRGKADSGQQSSSSEERHHKACSRDSFSESTESCALDGSTSVACTGEVAEEGAEKGSLRKLLGFIAEKLWGIWN